MMGRLTFHILDEQCQKWFIVGLWSHICCLLTKQKVTSQPEALEIMMKLETSLVRDCIGMEYVQSQLPTLIIQFSNIMKEKEKHEHVWCIKCKTNGHRKEECPTFVKYMDTREFDPLVGGVGYYDICKTWGNHLNSFPQLNKYQSTPRNLFGTFENR
jgi:hypothetical protein